METDLKTDVHPAQLPTRRLGRNVRRTVVGTLAAGLLLVACGDDGDPVASTGTTGAPETTVPETTVPDDTVTVTLADYAFEDLPESVDAGTKFAISNSSKTEVHELVAVKLPDTETRSAEELGTLPIDQLMGLFTGEPAMVLLAGPNGGDQVTAVGDGTLTEPGRYFLVCTIPTGADPAEFLEAAATSDGPPQVDGGPPHLMNGMYAEITVE